MVTTEDAFITGPAVVGARWGRMVAVWAVSPPTLRYVRQREALTSRADCEYQVQVGQYGEEEVSHAKPMHGTPLLVALYLVLTVSLVSGIENRGDP